MKLIPKIAVILENHAKRKTLQQLRSMSDRQLIDCGYSPELLREGIKAWPWRELPESIAPIQFDQLLNHGSVSKKNEHTPKTVEKRFLAQQDAA